MSDMSPIPDDSLHVNAQGLACPLPVIELAKAIETIDVGQVVKLTATDPAAAVDVPVWCRMQRQLLLRHDTIDGIACFWVQRVR